MVEVITTPDGFEITTDGGILVVNTEYPPAGKTAVLHNQLTEWSANKARQYLSIFDEVRIMLKAEGYQYLMALSDHADTKMLKYWKFMGFKFFGKQGGLDYAVMEV